MIRTASLTVAAVLLLAGCTTLPRPLQGEFAPLQPADAARDGAVGAPVRWGGRIVSVQPEADRTCFEIVAITLGRDARPLRRDHSPGRFLACRAGYYEPEIFQPGRDVTLVGRVEGFETRKVGDFDYRYPRIDAGVVYLWPERRDVDVIVERRPWGW